MKRITDLNLAAYLVASDFRISDIEPTGARKTFIFADVPDGAIVEFYSGSDRTSARKLLGALRDLKALATQPL